MVDETIAQAVPEPDDVVAKANAAAERLEKANAEMKLILAQHEKNRVESILGGKASAGAPQAAEKTQEQKEKEIARNFLKGTGYDDELFPL
jgi:hypothetical protein